MSDHPSATNDNETGSRDARRKKILFVAGTGA